VGTLRFAHPTDLAPSPLRCRSASRWPRRVAARLHPSDLAEDGEHLGVNAIAFIPGMTIRLRDPAAGCARVVPERCALSKRGRAGMPGARRTRSLMCVCWSLRMHMSIHSGRTGNHPASPHAMVLTAYTGSPRRSGFLASVACRIISANLTPASRRQDHTTSPSAWVPFVSSTATSTASRALRP
jgi:hypothetical protein